MRTVYHDENTLLFNEMIMVSVLKEPIHWCLFVVLVMIHRSHSLTSDRSIINKISCRNIGGLEKTTVALNEQEEWRIFILCSYKIVSVLKEPIHWCLFV
jgi:hypothetical protein